MSSSFSSFKFYILLACFDFNLIFDWILFCQFFFKLALAMAKREKINSGTENGTVIDLFSEMKLYLELQLYTPDLTTL